MQGVVQQEVDRHLKLLGVIFVDSKYAFLITDLSIDDIITILNYDSFNLKIHQ
jgi:hypothetical protein